MRIQLAAASLAIMLATPLSPAFANDEPDIPTPHPGLTPAEVVGAQLNAMQNNDEPAQDAGIAVAWQFAAPGNKALTGPLERFIVMIHEGYPEMLNFTKMQLPEAVVDGPEALQPVILEKDGESWEYLFYLRRQGEGECVGCWMTEGVMRPPEPLPAEGGTI